MSLITHIDNSNTNDSQHSGNNILMSKRSIYVLYLFPRKILLSTFQKMQGARKDVRIWRSNCLCLISEVHRLPNKRKQGQIWQGITINKISSHTRMQKPCLLLYHFPLMRGLSAIVKKFSCFKDECIFDLPICTSLTNSPMSNLPTTFIWIYKHFD